MKKFFQDFKEFAMKGNILDMAVGVVIGAAFKDIVNALVNNIITPLIVLITGKNSLEALKWVLKPEILDEAGAVVDPGVAVEYGIFLQAIVDFLIIAFTIFVILRVMMNTQKKLEELRHKNDEPVVEEAPAEPVEDEVSLLKEIRDMLKEDKKE
ncbi:MAG: large conductance mechanosensitive channel protein MscL [Clostridia bacterium]|nr:large conductance mechanosensitive channel protein MscL [Clostridia bacterium]